jgi:small-conductance mechanosensitive channel
VAPWHGKASVFTISLAFIVLYLLVAAFVFYPIALSFAAWHEETNGSRDRSFMMGVLLSFVIWSSLLLTGAALSWTMVLNEKHLRLYTERFQKIRQSIIRPEVIPYRKMLDDYPIHMVVYYYLPLIVLCVFCSSFLDLLFVSLIFLLNACVLYGLTRVQAHFLREYVPELPADEVPPDTAHEHGEKES